MKLKTLKDIKKMYGKNQRNVVGAKQLKQEAIKHIKAWENSIGGQAVIEFIKDFFNITEEDLK